MPNDLKIVEEATTVAMIKAFEETKQECNTTVQLVNSAHDQLMTTWGGVAAKKYDESMAEWKAGFRKVEQALELLNSSMVDYSRTTTSTEDDNVQTSGGWAHFAG